MTTQTSISFLPLLAAAALVGCSSSEPPTLVTTATLTRAQSCDHLLQLLRADAKAKVDMSIDAQIYWLENADDFDLRGVAVEDAGGGEAPTNQGGDLSSAPPSHSETNVQVEGVDEADIVKTDGNYLYLLQGTELAIVNAWPAETMSVGSTQAIEGHPLEMFLTDEHVVVFSTVWQDGGRGVPEWDYGYYGEPLTKVTIFSASGGTASVVDELYFEGSYTSARRIGSQVRLAMNSWYYPTFLGYGLDTWSESRSDMIDAYEELRDKSHARIEAATLPDFVPSRFARQGNELVEVATSCGDFYVPTSGSTQWGYAQLASFDLDNLSAGVKNTTIVGQASTIYSSHDALYIAGQSYSEAVWAVAYSSEEPQSTSYTHVHKFDIATDPAEPTYVASASAPGWVINQFSLDEHEGNLRMATTDTLVGRDTWDTVNNLFTLDGGMHQLGAVTGLAPGESVFSARFVGDRGYVVTFRQVDPLFVFDLSNPASPQKVAELKIPGFSTYMHPIEGGDYLLTVGHDGDWQGNVGDPALSIFDVRQADNPVLLHKLVLDSGYSEAEYNHKAFTFYEGKLAIPFADWSGPSYSSRLDLFDVDVTMGIQKRGSVDHTPLFSNMNIDDCYYYGWGIDVRRGVFIEDYVYSVSNGGVVVSNVSDLATVATLPLPASFENDPYGACGYYY